ncbi:hypothetical protein BHF71_03120 [Vulcanibacillus modesticaldus]|uniref:SH3b domain-containing protein n=1 Tax=Vulcanibacillus modesticaldus TaxID=337097 RepID=A0A1D2YTC0_9BACI|nr:hypothetical protein BHF71_03120 [Vulcanibacillus modesticaldus]
MKVKVDELNVRSGPGLGYNVLTTIAKDQQYPVIEEKNKWIKLKINDQIGWVAGWLVDYVKSTKTIESKVQSLNVRSGPSTSFPILEQIYPGSKYPIVEEEGDWFKIQLNKNKTGWVAGWLIKIAETPSSEISTMSEFVTIKANTLNVRSGPSTEYSIIGKLKKGEQVEIIDIEQAWYKIKFNKQIGWIASEYASKNTLTVSSKNTIQDKENNKEQKIVVVSPEILNLRSGPGLNYEVVAKLLKNDFLVVDDSKGEWLHVAKATNPEVNGWVAKWLVIDSSQVISNRPTVTILNPGTNLREGPSTSYRVVSLGNVGDQFPILGTKGDWYQILLPNGDKAFVAGWIVSVKGMNQVISSGIKRLLKDKIIVVDAGHGGKDHGATGATFKSLEKDLNLAVAMRLQKKLEAAGAKVIMTRSKDKYLTLQERVNIAITNNADAFISIHHNTHENSAVNGTITYYYLKKNKELAKNIQRELLKRTGLKDLNVRFGNYHVLRENPKLAVLTELAFISNYYDELKVLSKSFQENAAEGIFQGILKYFNSNK